MAYLHLLFAGSEYTITAYGKEEASCEIVDFLEDRKILTANDEDALRELFAWHGNHGQIRNKTKCNFLGDGLFEYKAPEGGRICWFYDQGFLVVCACAVVKKKQKADPAFIAKALQIRDEYLREKAHGKIHRPF